MVDQEYKIIIFLQRAALKMTFMQCALQHLHCVYMRLKMLQGLGISARIVGFFIGYRSLSI
jgi:hypothetical protein